MTGALVIPFSDCINIYCVPSITKKNPKKILNKPKTAKWDIGSLTNAYIFGLSYTFAYNITP